MRNTYKIITHFTGEKNEHLGLSGTKDYVKRHLGFALGLLNLGVWSFIHLLVDDKCSATVYVKNCTIWLICDNYASLKH